MLGSVHLLSRLIAGASCIAFSTNFFYQHILRAALKRVDVPVHLETRDPAQAERADVEIDSSYLNLQRGELVCGHVVLMSNC